MIALSIALNVLLITIFKLYKKFRVYNLSAIVVNYFVCYITASLVMGRVATEFADEEATHASLIQQKLEQAESLDESRCYDPDPPHMPE